MKDAKIQSDEEYQQALEELWKLWKCQKDTPEAERFFKLAQAIHEYEEANFPM